MAVGGMRSWVTLVRGMRSKGTQVHKVYQGIGVLGMALIFLVHSARCIQAQGRGILHCLHA